MQIAVLLLVLSASATIADQFDHLTPRTSGISAALNGIVYGMSNYVAVGNGGVLLKSQDSLVWNRQPSPTAANLTGIAFGSGLFVSVGEGGTVLTSSDGAFWTTRASGTTNNLRAIAFGGGTFVAVGDGGTVLNSTNGLSWTIRATGVPNNLNGVAYGLADVHTESYRFVAVGGAGTILTSANGSVWTIRSSGTFLDLFGVALGINQSGVDVVVGQSGVAVTSSDTITWTVQDTGTTANLYAVAADPGGYYSGPLLQNGPLGTFGAVGEGGTFMTTSDGGVSWTAQSAEATKPLRAITFENGGFLAVGDSGAIQAGFVWVERASGLDTALYSITRGADRFVAVGALGTIVTSTNGADWRVVQSGTVSGLVEVIYAANRFVAVGDDGVVTSSTNGLDWDSEVVFGGSNLTRIVYGNGRFLVVGDYYAPPFRATFTALSTNGSDWTVGPGLPGGDVAFGANLFCAVGYGTIYTSSDGAQWFPQESGFDYQMSGVSYANGELVTAGQYISGETARMLTSPNGTNWTSHPSGYFSGVTCSGHAAFVGLGSGLIGKDLGTVYITSSDGVNWTSRGTGSVADVPLSLSAIAFGIGTFVAVGDGGLIVQSVATPSLLAVSAVPEGLRVTSTGNIGRNLVLETAPALTQNLWTELGSITNAPFRIDYVDVGTNAPQRFYRSREF